MRYFTYILVLFFLISCNSSNTIYEKPDDLIPKDTLQLLLMDMYLAVSSRNVKDLCSKKRGNYLPFVFEKYKIDSTRFYSSNNYYTSKIEVYKDILTVVKDTIQKEFDFFEYELKRKDSLKKKKKEKSRLKLKAKDSLRTLKETAKKKGYIPFIAEQIKKDTTHFYDKNNYYQIKKEIYNLIINKEEQEKNLELEAPVILKK